MNPVSKQMGLNTVVEAMAEYLKKDGKSTLVGGPVIPERALTKLDEACGYPVARMPLAKGLVFENHENLIALCAKIMRLADACLTGGPIFSNYDGSVGYSILPKKKAIIMRTEQVSAANDFVFGCTLMQELLLALAKRIKRYTTTYRNYHQNLLTDSQPDKEPLRVNVHIQKFLSLLLKEKAVIVWAERVSSANGSAFGNILMQDLLLADAKWLMRYTAAYKNYHQLFLTDSHAAKEPLRVNVEMQKLLSGDTAVIFGFGYEIQMHGSIKWYAINKRMIACSSGNGKFQVTAQNVSTRLCCRQNITIFLVKNGRCLGPFVGEMPNLVNVLGENLMSKHQMKSSKMAAAGGRKRARRSGGGEGPWKRTRRTCGRLLPEELIISEILPKLPVKSLMRLKSVCKSWQSVISGGDRHLIRSHLQGSRQQLCVLVAPSDRVVSGIVSCHFVQERLSNNCVSEFLGGMPDLKDVDSACRPSHCDGLVLFSSSTKYSHESASGTRLQVCNPATREVVTLPTSNNINNPSRVKPRILPNNAVALGVDPLTNKYKVVRIFYRSSDLLTRTCSVGVEVLTLGSRSLCWIPEQQDPPYPIWPCHQASTAEGVIYWLVDNALHSSSPRAIISFNLGDGKFGVIPPPPTWAERDLELFYKEASLTVLDGDLCCSHSCGPVRHESVYRKGAWHISHSHPLGVHPLGSASDGRMLVYDDDNHSFGYCDHGEHTTELIPGSTDKWPTYSEEGGEPWFYVHIVPYCESLVPIFSETSVLGMNALAGGSP